MHPTSPGISAISVYLPPYRVDLEQWCSWTGAPWAKVAAVVGNGFRVCGPEQNAYTMAASAALSLILDNDIDPRRVGYLALGTESSTDNAAGAVIVRGMLDQALRELGLPILARDCEVPEFKHACLGGVYAMKAAARYLSCDGADRVAIVIASDIAQYERGSTGEQTQGAGAVAMAMEREPKLLALDLAHSGSASSYRGYDFRKPFARHFMPGYGGSGRDYPVFNGRYSTLCYLDEVICAIDQMFAKLGVEGPRRPFYDQLGGIFFHRPYQHLPSTALATALVWSLSREPEGAEELGELCAQAGVDLGLVLEQITRLSDPEFDLWTEVLAKGADHDPLAAVSAVTKQFRRGAYFRGFAADKLGLGASFVREVGNLYTASLPAWLAAGLDDARSQPELELAGKQLLLVGYGSGDAAEAMLATVMPGWREAAGTIRFADTLAGSQQLTREDYEALHAGRELDGTAAPASGFRIAEVGARNEPGFSDIGVEYYAFAG